MADDRTRDLAIGVGPVNLTDYVARSQIVTRSGANKLFLTDFDKWAGSLSSDIPRTLSDNLSTLLETQKVVLYPWPRSLKVNYQVAVDITGFEGGPGNLATLRANWILFGGGGEKILHLGKKVFQTSATSEKIDDLVGALSHNLAEFSREIAKTIHEMESRADLHK
jgi:uncharacterized lipoprotein YmbA